MRKQAPREGEGLGLGYTGSTAEPWACGEGLPEAQALVGGSFRGWCGRTVWFLLAARSTFTRAGDVSKGTMGTPGAALSHRAPAVCQDHSGCLPASAAVSLLRFTHVLHLPSYCPKTTPFRVYQPIFQMRTLQSREVMLFIWFPVRRMWGWTWTSVSMPPGARCPQRLSAALAPLGCGGVQLLSWSECAQALPVLQPHTESRGWSGGT